MDYKELYEQALERASKLYGAGTITESLSYVFPELKENEDERIRKTLIRYMASVIDIDGIKGKDIIAWLEKQESVGEIVSRCRTSWYNEGKIQGQIEGLTDDEKYQQGWHDALEKQGKQKSADKVEPKFKVGDWIIDKQGLVHQIENVVENVTNHTFGYDIVGGGYFNDNSDVRLWTINDAKEGDVLCYKDEISLYKHDIKNCTKQETTFGGFVYHCCYDGKRFIMDSLYSLTEQDKIDIHPATKEQCDQLEKAMADAGYKWNASEKKLEKIEQILANSCKTCKEWSEEDEKIRDNLIHYFGLDKEQSTQEDMGT